MIFFSRGSYSLISVLILFSSTLMFVTGCNQANFTGTNPSRGIDETSEGIACHIDPSKIALGDMAQITLSLPSGYRGTLTRTDYDGDEVKETSIAVTDETSPDLPIAPKFAGTYKVELRESLDQEEPSAVCLVEVINEDAPSLACKAVPASVVEGESFTVEVTSTGLSEIGVVKANGVGLPGETELKYDDEKGKYVVGPTGSMTPSLAGTGEIEITVGEAQASCSVVVTEKEKPCEDSEKSIGAHIAFLIDNSNSNAATDCAEKNLVGKHADVDLYECTSQTNREKAVLSAFDLMRQVQENEPDNLDAKSEIAITSFPTRENFIDGSKVNTKWVETSANSKDTVVNGLGFTRKPFGLTPYGAAMQAATDLFASMPDTDKNKVAVLVTDGEPTDRDPAAVLALADALKEKGVELVTVFVNSGEERSSRIETHTAMMQKIQDSSVAADKGNWFSDAYNAFGSYIDELLGNGNDDSLAERLSSDSQYPRIVEVEKSEELAEVFKSLVKTRAIQCE